MFYCDPCAVDLGWPREFYLPCSDGRCEMCTAIGTCFDVPSSYLPIPTAEQHAKVAARRAQRGGKR